MTRKLRVLALILLLLGVILQRGWDTHEILFGHRINPGLDIQVEDGKLVVSRITETGLLGNANPVYQAGVRSGDALVSVSNSRGEGRKIGSMSDVIAVLRKVDDREPWGVVVSRKTKTTIQKLAMTVSPVPEGSRTFSDRLSALFFGLFVPCLAIGTGFFVGFSKPEDDRAFVACLLFVSFSGIFSSGLFYQPPLLLPVIIFLRTSMDSFLTFLFLAFFLIFPSPSWIDRKFPRLKYAFLVLSVLIWLQELWFTYLEYTSLARYAELNDTMDRWKVSVAFPYVPIVMLLIAFSSLVLNTVKAPTRDEKRRMVILLCGTLIGIVPLVGFVLWVKVFGVGEPPRWAIGVLIGTLAVFPITFAYVVVRHRVLGVSVILRRGLQYLFVSRGFIVLQAVITFLIIYFGVARTGLFQRVFDAGGLPALVASMAFMSLLVFFALSPLNRRVMPMIDRHFFREALNAQQVLTELSRAVSRLVTDPVKLLELVTEKIGNSLHPDQVGVFLRGLNPAVEGPMRVVAAVGAEDFRCCQLYQRTASQAHVLSTGSELAFPSSGLLARALQKNADDPQALEVYLDDPRSWVSALVRIQDQSDARYLERQLIEKLNTRLLLPLVTNNGLVGFISLGEKLSEEPYSGEDKELLLTVAHQTAVALDYSRLFAQAAEQEKMKREIEIAKQVQAQLFPQSLPEPRTLECTAICRSARGVGGDYYDFLPLGPDQLGIALGDVSGKGISAALLMAGLQALLRSNAPTHKTSISTLLGVMNRLMSASTARGKYATFFYGFYDGELHTLHYANAGHLPPMLFRNSGEVLRLPAGGMVLGMFPDAVYKQAELDLHTGDVLVIFSDGVSEALNEAEEEFGEERLQQVVQAHLHLSAVAIQEALLQSVADFVGTAPQHDDLTMVITRVIA